MHNSFVRLAAATPTLRVGDCQYNADQCLNVMRNASKQHVSVLVFPELSITGYTCADLFHQTALQQAAIQSLGRICEEGKKEFNGLAVVGLPLVVDDQLFNCAALIQNGDILGIVPKSYIPNYNEFYEARWFAPAAVAHSDRVRINGRAVPFGVDLLFPCNNLPACVVGVEICEDIWVPIPPSSYQALAGATVLVNLSASNEVIGKAGYRRQLVVGQSGRCVAAYAYASCGVYESSTDLVFGGHSLIAENGSLLAESQRYERDGTLLIADVDLDRLKNDRRKSNSFGSSRLYAENQRKFRRIEFALDRKTTTKLIRPVEAHPFVPRGKEQLRQRCEEIFQTQVSGLATRLEHIGKPPVTIGISGGLDSTLALLVTCKTMDAIGVSRDRIRAITMPGFGTSDRTRNNATSLMDQLGVTADTVDIRAMCFEEMKALEHRPFEIDLDGLSLTELTERLKCVPPEKRHDLVFENVQARMRTSILMNTGFVIGTGDLSEAALGWCTYNGDHMNMYNPNCSIPKTLVKFLVQWAAGNEFEGEATRILLDIVDTEISPELLPIADGKQVVQATEDIIGPYELHDFFLYHFIRFGETPEKILYLAGHAKFHRSYSSDELRHWLGIFLKRFFANQFKRSCVPDGPKVGTISLSPRGDWRMPSDAKADVWQTGIEKEELRKAG